MNRHVEEIRKEQARDARSHGNAKEPKVQLLAEYDATRNVGLRVCIHDGAIEVGEGDDAVTEILDLSQLIAAAAMARCLMPIRLRGSELKAIRKAMGLTMAEFAKRLDEKTAPETISRWESEAQPMGGYVEKLVRLVACEALTGAAPGISYNAGMIAHLMVQDPWLTNSEFEVPCMHLEYTRMKERSGNVAEVYADYKEAA